MTMMTADCTQNRMMKVEKCCIISKESPQTEPLVLLFDGHENSGSTEGNFHPHTGSVHSGMGLRKEKPFFLSF